MIKRARKRLIRTVTPVQALAATLTGVVDVEEVPYEAVVGASLLKVRDRLRDAATGEPVDVPPGLAGRAPRLPAPRPDLAGRAHLDSGLGACLADDMGLGKTDHPDRAAPAPRRRRGRRAHARGLPGVAARQLGGRDPTLRAGRRRTPPPRQRPRPRRRHRRLRAHDLRHDAQRRGARSPRCRGTWSSPTRRSTSRTPGPPPPARCAPIPSRARVALTGTPVENDLTELWSILDWAIPGLLGSRNAFRKVWAGADRVGARAHQGPAVRRPDRPVPAAPPQVRPRHRAGAAGQDRDRPPPRPDPRAGRPLRDARARVDAPHRGGRRGDPPRAGAQAAHRPQADLQPPRPLPAPAQPQAARPLGEARPPRRARRHGDRRGRRRARLHPVRRHGAPARAPPRRRPACPHQFLHGGTPVARARRDGRPVPGGRGPGVPALAQGRRHRAQPHRAPTTSSTSTAGGTPPSRTRPPTGPTGSARPARCRCTASSPRARSRRRSPSCSPASGRSPTRS